MARSTVELIVDASKAVSPLKQVTAETKKLEAATRDMNGRLRDSKGRFVASGDSARKASFSFKRFADEIKRTAGALAAFSFAQSTVNAAISRAESERRIKLLAKGYGEVEALSDAASKAATRFGLSQTTANQSLANAYARLRPLNVSLDDIESTFNGFNTAAKLGGATSQEAAAAFTQLSQALGSGALRGDEFRSIAEQAPLVLKAISDQTGIATGDLKDYAAQGLITSDIVIAALRRIEDEGAAKLKEALEGPAQQLIDLKNRTEDLQVSIGNLALPIVLEVVDDLATKAESLTDLIDKLGKAFGGLGNFLDPVISKLQQVNDLISNLNPLILALNFLPGMLDKYLGLAAPEASKPTKQGKKPKVTRTTPTITRLGETRKGVSPEEKERLRIQKLVQRLEEDALETQRRQAQSFEDQRRSVDERRMIQLGILNGNKKEVENAILLGNLQRDYGEQKGMQLYLEELNVQKLEEQNRKRKEAADAQKKNVEELKRLYESLGQTVATSVVDNLIAAVDQTKSLGEALSDVLRSIGDQLLSFGVGKVGTGIGNLLGDLFKADGGPVRGGRSYIVGERGPEVFTPGSGGTIVPNNALGGGGGGVNVGTINISVENTGEQLSAKAQKQLAGEVRGIVLNTLANERRSGGML